MISDFIRPIRLLPLVTSLFISACACIDGSNLKPGQDDLSEVERTLGKPAMRWQDKDGSQQLAYTQRGGPRNLMVIIGADGKLHSIRNVLEAGSFALIQPGMSKDEVLRRLGPSDPTLTIFFQRRNELTWGWTFQEIGEHTNFFVLFDAEKGIVRSTMIAPFRVIVDVN